MAGIYREFRATILSTESVSMNSSATSPHRPPNVSGAIRYERIAILEAALKIKEQRQRQWWTKALLSVAVLAVAAASVVLTVS